MIKSRCVTNICRWNATLIFISFDGPWSCEVLAFSHTSSRNNWMEFFRQWGIEVFFSKLKQRLRFFNDMERCTLCDGLTIRVQNYKKIQDMIGRFYFRINTVWGSGEDVVFQTVRHDTNGELGLALFECSLFREQQYRKTLLTKPSHTSKGLFMPFLKSIFIL